MQVLPRWRSVLILHNSIICSATTASSSTPLASFHSTPASFDKKKNKGNPDVRRGQQQSKKHIRFETRQKRADAKQALKDLLFRNGASKFQDYFPKTDGTSWNTESVDDSDSSDKRTRSKFSTCRASKAQQKKMKRKHKRESFSDDFDEHPERIFQASFGGRWYTWSYNAWKESCNQNPTNGFEWREQSKWTNSTNREWQNESDIESDDECVIGLSSDRTMLGLPPSGPLKMEDVKNAFRSSALKWHPDKHQGPSQATAEEKFKRCVNAYKSLCSALSSA